MSDCAPQRDEQAAILAELTQQAQDVGFYGQRPAVLPATIIDLGTPSLRLTQSVPIIIEQYEDQVTASWPEVEAFGAGDSDVEAIVALKRDIVALYRYFVDSG